MKIKLGTRGSALAIAQAEIVRDNIKNHHPECEIDIITIKTTGDKILDQNLSAIGGKGLFTKEIEQALINKEIDIAVHSMKDVTAIIPDELEIACVLKRENPFDVFISYKYNNINEIPDGAVIGTSSPRRAAQLLHLKPKSTIIPFRGNVQTRLEKLKDGNVDGTFLAAAGLKRLGIEVSQQLLDKSQMLPAVAQGAIGVETHRDNHKIKKILKSINCTDSFNCIAAERSFLRIFEGSCKTPVAAIAQLSGSMLELDCLIAKIDGSEIIRTHRKGNVADGNNMAIDAAYELKAKGGNNFFE